MDYMTYNGMKHSNDPLWHLTMIIVVVSDKFAPVSLQTRNLLILLLIVSVMLN